MSYPPWVVLHVPHDSVNIPKGVRNQFLLNDEELVTELTRMTDHRTLALFSDQSSAAQVVRAPVSRLVLDVERFDDDEREPMAARGMGSIYSVTSHLEPLRRPLSPPEREELMLAYYHPHHARLEAAVEAALERFDRCLVVDCHSFPGKALPYEFADPDVVRPDICIGTDEFHTNETLINGFVAAFESAGWSVKVNDPFSGALVPRSRYCRDRRVGAIMVEVNRALYLADFSSEELENFGNVSQTIKRCCIMGISGWGPRQADERKVGL